MVFANRVFLGKSIKDDPSKIIKKLKKNAPVKGVFIISPAENGIDPLEYYDSLQLNQSYYKNRELKIIGNIRKRGHRAYPGDIRSFDRIRT